MRSSVRRWTIGLILGVVLLLPGVAHAHKVVAYADAYGTEVEGGAAFSSGDPITGAKVTVYFPDGKVALETKCDENGEFAFEAPYRCTYRVVVDAGEGHKAEARVREENLDASLPPYKGGGAPAAAPTSEAVAETTAEAPDAVAGAAAAGVSPDVAAERIDEALKKRLRPLNERIDQLTEKMWFRDILGSIGFIFGVFGVAFYVLGKRSASSGGTPPKQG